LGKGKEKKGDSPGGGAVFGVQGNVFPAEDPRKTSFARCHQGKPGSQEPRPQFAMEDLVAKGQNSVETATRGLAAPGGGLARHEKRRNLSRGEVIQPQPKRVKGRH